MEREYKTVRLTQEDKKGFHFQEVQDEERAKQICSLGKVRNRYLIGEGIVFAIGSVTGLGCLYKGKTAWGMIGCLVAVCMICAVLMTLYLWGYNVKVFRSSGWMEIRIELCGKLPVEKEYSMQTEGVNTLYTFYPVTGKDVQTGYISKVYIGREEYEGFETGKIINVRFNMDLERE